MKIRVNDSDPRHPTIHVMTEGYGGDELTAVEAERVIKELRAAIDRVRSLSQKPRSFKERL